MTRPTYLHHHYCFLHHVAYSRADQIKENIHASLGRCINLNGTLSNRPNRPPDKIHVNFGGIPVELDEQESIIRIGDSGHSLSSLSNASTFFSCASRIMTSSFSTLMYRGSLYLQKNTRISFWRRSERFCSKRLIFLSATHWTSCSAETSVTK